MAISLDANLGSLNQTSNSTSIVLTTAKAAPAGSFIVLGVGWFESGFTLSGVSGGGLSWTIDKQGHTGSGTGGPDSTAIVSAQAPSGLAASSAITATYSGSTPARCIGGSAFTGVVTSSPVDGTPTGPTIGATVAAWSTASYAMQAGSLLVAACFNEGPIASQAATAPAQEAWETINGLDDFGMVLAYRVAPTAGSYTAAGTWDVASIHSNTSVAYLAAEGEDVGLAWMGTG